MKFSFVSKRPETFGQTEFQTEIIDKTLIMGKLALIIDAVRTAIDCHVDKWDVSRQPDSFMDDYEETIEIKLSLKHQGITSMAKGLKA